MDYKSLLIIDDDTDDQDIFCSAAEEVSDAIQCISMTNAKEALQKLKAKEIIPDVIFLDLNMPIMTGQEFLQQIKQINPLNKIPVIIFTTSASPATIAETKELGAANFVTKPNSFDELIKILTFLFTTKLSWA